ncbi:hypothetical protein V6259_12640 [Marinomonas sp. TI.3.20]
MTIIKDKNQTSSNDPRIAAEIKHDLDVAFYLRRAFKNSEKSNQRVLAAN